MFHLVLNPLGNLFVTWLAALHLARCWRGSSLRLSVGRRRPDLDCPRDAGPRCAARRRIANKAPVFVRGFGYADYRARVEAVTTSRGRGRRLYQD